MEKYKFILCYMMMGCFLFNHSLLGQNALLWEISGNKLTSPSYLYGTIHIKDKRAFEFNDSVIVKLNQCSSFAMELIMDSSNIAKISNAMKFEGGKTLSNIYSQEDYKLINDVVKKTVGIDLSLLNTMKPFAIASFVMQSKMSKDFPDAVDMYLYKKAKEKRKKIIGIETVEEQIKAINKIPSEFFIKYFKEINKCDSLLEELIKAYQIEELNKIRSIIEDNSNTLEFQFDKELIIERNYIMADRINQIIAKESTFIALGVGHLSGERGIIELLKKRGYKVNPIIAPHSKKVDTETSWNKFESTKGGFSILVPTIPVEKEQQVESDVGTLNMHMFSMKVNGYKEKNLYYGITYTTYPDSTVSSLNRDNMKSFFNNSRQGMIAKISGELVAEKNIFIKEYPGREYKIRFNNGGTIMKIRSYLVKNKMYILQVIMEAKNESNDYSDKFMNSFNLIDEIELENAETYRKIGIEKYTLGEYQEAIDAFDKSIKIQHDFPEAYNGRGIVKYAIEDYKGAVEDYTKAIELNPDYSKAYYNRSIAKKELRYYQEAIKDCDKAIELKPDYGEAFYSKGVIMNSMGNTKEACENWKKAKKLGVNDVDSFIKEHCN